LRLPHASALGQSVNQPARFHSEGAGDRNDCAQARVGFLTLFELREVGNAEARLDPHFLLGQPGGGPQFLEPLRERGKRIDSHSDYFTPVSLKDYLKNNIAFLADTFEGLLPRR
jgi:hypothetical protein